MKMMKKAIFHIQNDNIVVAEAWQLLSICFFYNLSCFTPPGERRISEISPPLLSGSELYKNLSFSRPKSIFCLLEPLLSPFTKLFPPFFTASFFLCSLYRVKAQPMDSLLVCFAKHIMHFIVIVKVT